MTLHIRLTDGERAALRQAYEGIPARHPIIKARARLLLLMDTGLKARTAAQGAGRSYAWATATIAEYRRGGVEAILAPCPYERRDRIPPPEALVDAVARVDALPTGIPAIPQRQPRPTPSLDHPPTYPPRPPRQPHPPCQPPTSSNRADLVSRDALVAELRRRGQTLRAISRVLGVTSERVRQILIRAAADGYEVAPSVRLYTLAAAARELGVGEQLLLATVRRLWPDDPIRCPKQGSLGRGHAGQCRLAGGARLTEHDLEPIRAELSRTASYCRVCGVELPRTGNRRAACLEHRAEHYHRLRERVRASPATPANTAPGSTTHIAAKILEGVAPDPDSGYYQFVEVVRLTGLSRMQVHWLGLRRVLATTGDPSGRRHMVTKKPIRVYYRNQVDELVRALGHAITDAGTAAP